MKPEQEFDLVDVRCGFEATIKFKQTPPAKLFCPKCGKRLWLEEKEAKS